VAEDIDPNEDFSAALSAAVERQNSAGTEDEPADDVIEPPLVETDEDEGDEPEGDELSDEERLLEEKFGGDPAKLAKSYRELERKLGEQGNELGKVRELEAQLNELQAALRTGPQQQPQQQYAVDDEWVEEVAMQNPAAYAQWAIQNAQPQVYNAVMDAWFEESPRQALELALELRLQHERQRVQAEIQPARQMAQNNQFQDAFQEAWTGLKGELSQHGVDLDAEGDAVVAEAQRQYEEGKHEFVAALQSADPSKIKGTLENLYILSRGRQAGTLTNATVESARQEAAKAADLKRRTATMRPSSGTVAGGKQQSAVDQFKERMLQNPTDIASALAQNQ
jgi:hypothetical protein